MRFWDASALIPLCLNEPRTPLLRKVTAEDPAITAWWGTPVECCSAFARLRRDGVLTRADEDQARQVLTRLAAAWTEIQPGRDVREGAARVLLLHPLRTGDALQLAAALLWARGRATPGQLVCLDSRLRDAAQREGFLVIPETTP